LTATYLLGWGNATKACRGLHQKGTGGFGGRPSRSDSCGLAIIAKPAPYCANRWSQTTSTFVPGILVKLRRQRNTGARQAASGADWGFCRSQRRTSPAERLPCRACYAAAFPAEANYATKTLKRKKGIFTAAESSPELSGPQTTGPFFSGRGREPDAALVPAASADLSSR